MQNFATFLKVILTKHAQNESNLPCQNALKLTYGNVKIKKFSGGYNLGPPLTGEGRKMEGDKRESRGRQRGNLPESGAFRGTAMGVTWLEVFLTLK